MAIVVILQSRGDVRDRLQQRAAARGDMTSRALAAVGRVWHVFAILYVLIFFVVWVSRPGDALTYMLAATGQSLAAALVGFLNAPRIPCDPGTHPGAPRERDTPVRPQPR